MERSLKERSGDFQIHISTGAAIVLAATILTAVGIYVRWQSNPTTEAPVLPLQRQLTRGNLGSKNTEFSEASQVRRGNRGAWGELEYIRVLLERPDEFLVRNFTSTLPTRWFFEGFSEEALADMFTSSKLSESHKKTLLNRSCWEVTRQGVYVEPGTELIFGLSSDSRKQIYSILAKSPLNYFHHSPFLLYFEEAEDWFKESGLTPETENLLRGMIYRSDNALVFADLPEVYAVVSSGWERRRLIKTVSRNDTLIMKIRVSNSSDIDSLVSYWGKGGRAKDIKPLLESLARVPGGASIDVAHLMPPLARQRLYTFPYPTDGKVIVDRNCFWTALNFFNEEPDDRYCEIKFTEEIIRRDYYPIQDDPTFGDVIFLLDSRESVIHAAVFIADDKVFTKNGRDFTEPWKITDVRDMLSEYSWNDPVRPVVYRQRRL